MTDIANAGEVVQKVQAREARETTDCRRARHAPQRHFVAHHLLSVLGVDLGDDLLAGAADNEMGYWENESIYRVQDALLNEFARDWGELGFVYPFALDWKRLPELQSYREKLVSIVRAELAAAKEMWGFKDPRTCRLLPLWKQIFEELNLEPLYVLAVRNPAVVADSLSKRNGVEPLHSELVWLLHNLDAIREVGPDLRIVVDYDRWFTAPHEQAQAVAQALHLPWPADDRDLMARLTETIRPALRHSEAKRPCSLPFVAKTYEALQRAARTGEMPDQVVLDDLGRASECLGAALELRPARARSPWRLVTRNSRREISKRRWRPLPEPRASSRGSPQPMPA